MDAILSNWRNVLFSILSGPLTQADRDQLENVEAYWVLLNTRSGRHFIDILGPAARLQAIGDRLTAMGRDPIVIAVFKPIDGDVLPPADPRGFRLSRKVPQLALEGAPNKAEWLKVARDVVTYNADGSVQSTARPTAYVDVHQWAGWGDKVIP